MQMKYRTLDGNGDYTLGRRRFLTGREAVGQAIETRMKLLYGEWWENTEDGLPLFEQILGRYGGDSIRQTVDLIFIERIQGTQNVVAVPQYESIFNADTRSYSASCTVDTVYGEIFISMANNLKNVEVSF